MMRIRHIPLLLALSGLMAASMLLSGLGAAFGGVVTTAALGVAAALGTDVDANLTVDTVTTMATIITAIFVPSQPRRKVTSMIGSGTRNNIGK